MVGTYPWSGGATLYREGKAALNYIPNMDSPPPAGFAYARQFCEENVFKLCESLLEMGADLERDDINVIFVSSLGKATPIWYQRAGKGDVVAWDYHVICQFAGDIFDLDTVLPFPTPITEYAELALQPQISLAAEHSQRFRVLPARDYIKLFASDRSHMAAAVASGQCAEPAWGAIRGAEALSAHTLPLFWDVSVLGGEGQEGSGMGVVMDRDGFFKWAETKCAEEEEEEEED